MDSERFKVSSSKVPTRLSVVTGQVRLVQAGFQAWFRLVRSDRVHVFRHGSG